MNVEFYFDPSCPFSWITSRWLHVVSAERDIKITWQPFSLALKNNELTKLPGETSYAKIHRSTHRLIRVILEASKQGADIGELYTAAGIQIHVVGKEVDDKLINHVIKSQQLAESLLAVADDTNLDKELQGSIKNATDIVGNDVGVPIIIFDAPSGGRQGYFGPVLNELPDKDESLLIWDGLSKLANVSSFYELKRTRPAGNPDVFSTAKC